jgi:hypothetical protein
MHTVHIHSNKTRINIMNKDSSLIRLSKITDQPAIQLELFPVTEVEVDGIQMGVLSDGTPYLTLRGLARMCGIDHTTLLQLANNWKDEQQKPRGIKIRELLATQGCNSDSLYIKTKSKFGETHAYTDSVCMAILEYYAFEATQASNGIALRNYRLLARYSFRSFIYNRCGYDPDKHIPDSWKNFHQRILLNDQIPVGYFSVFRELADLVVHMIQKSCPIDDHTVPDISVGLTWANYWNEHEFDDVYGNRIQHPHRYPEWYPQASANPVPAWIYPAQALGEFRIWLNTHYIPKNFPKYIEGKVKKGIFLPSRAELLLDAVTKPMLEE